MKYEWKCVHYLKQQQNRAGNSGTHRKEQRTKLTEGKFKMSDLHQDEQA